MPSSGKAMHQSESPEETCADFQTKLGVDERLARIESLMEALVKRDDKVASSFRAECHSKPNRADLENRAEDDSPEAQQAAASIGIDRISAPTTRLQNSPINSNLKEARKQLLRNFPCDTDAQVLHRESSTLMLYMHLIHTQPHSMLTAEKIAISTYNPELPSPESHPVVLAKHMILFAIALQSPCGEHLPELSEPKDILQRRLIRTATTWVAAREDLVCSIEGLVCIILEGVFETHCGNLRRAWMAYRRALTVGQSMGLDRNPLPRVKYIAPADDVDPRCIWFRIVYMDRYLSLLLGLPQGTPSRISVAPTQPSTDHPMDMFERRLADIASGILQRNERSFNGNDIDQTRSLDAQLLRAAAKMPASFWCPPSFEGLVPGEHGTLLETLRLGTQVYYHGLLIQLHLPYMIQTGNNTGRDYAKITCVSAGREILSCFIAHRRFNPLSSCSRPVDFFALLAAMAILLAHLYAHHQREGVNLLIHQRLADRALVEQVVDRMEMLRELKNDPVAAQSAHIIQQLLAIDTDAAEGKAFSTECLGQDHGLQHGKDGTTNLRLHIPFLGVIQISRQGSVTRETAPGGRRGNELSHFQEAGALASTNNAALASKVIPTLSMVPAVDDRLLSGSLGGGRTAIGPSIPHSHGVGSGTEPQHGANSQIPGFGLNDLQWPAFQDSCSDMANDNNNILDEWTLQGVDMAFFDSLMRGSTTGIEDDT